MGLIKPVYLVGHPDGVNDFMCVARSQKEAAAKMRMPLATLRRFGLRRLTPDNREAAVMIEIANSDPDRVWKKKVDHTYPQCWVFADRLHGGHGDTKGGE